MTKKIIFVIIVLMVILTQCSRSKYKENPEIVNKPEVIDSDRSQGLDFAKMQKAVDDSTSLTVDVFFAISVLHKYYISSFLGDAKGMSEDEQKIYFLKKKDSFFKTIKYSEDEYNDFMSNNIDLINEYIVSHKDIQEYLLTIN